MKLLWKFAVPVALGALSVAAVAQQTTPPPATTNDNAALLQMVKDLQERVIALEGQVRTLKEQQQQPPATPPASTTTEPSAAVPPTAPPATATTPQTTLTAQGETGSLPVYGGAGSAGKLLNPDVSVIGDFISTAGHNPVNPSPSFEMHESEVGLQAIIDPYARGDFFISFGEQGVNLEEGYITFTALPKGFVARAGKMRVAFGKVNSLHNHVLPWVDRPLVTQDLVGGEDGIDDAGFSVTRILPSPKWLFLEATGQVFRGDAEGVFKAWNKDSLSTVAHLRSYHDISEAWNMDVGASYSRGHSELSPIANVTNLYGVDATLRWKPLRRAIYHSFVGRSEVIWRDTPVPVGLPLAPVAVNKQLAMGWYASGDYQFARRWFAGLRVDRSELPFNTDQRDQGFSTVLTYWPSEFAQVRGQYRWTDHVNQGQTAPASELLFQVQFSLGAHGAHPF